MTADKRTVSTDALETLGTIITGTERRDAIHLAVVPAIANQGLAPGQWVTYHHGYAHDASMMDAPGIGIVDPFLRAPVEPGQRFWLVLRPRVITSLRHVWTHPDIPDEYGWHETNADPVENAKAWVSRFALEDMQMGYDRLMDAAMMFEAEDEYGGSRMELDNMELYKKVSAERWAEFWTHYRTITGRKGRGGSPFTCSC